MRSRNHKKRPYWIIEIKGLKLKILQTKFPISGNIIIFRFHGSSQKLSSLKLCRGGNHIAYFKSVQMETEIKCVIWSEAPSRSLAYPIHNGTLKALFYQNEYLIHVFSLCKLIIFIRGVFKPVWISLLWMKEQIELLQKPKTMREIVRI